MHSSADHQVVKGQLERKKKPIEIRGLNRELQSRSEESVQGSGDHGRDQARPFAQFYAALLAKGMRPEMARLTLARKIATIVLIVWKRGVCFDAQSSETTNSLSVSDRIRSILGIFSGGGRRVLETLWFESESQLIS